MHKFTTGLLTGGLMAAVGVSWMMSDNKTRKRVVKSGKRAMHKTGNFFDGMTDLFE